MFKGPANPSGRVRKPPSIVTSATTTVVKRKKKPTVSLRLSDDDDNDDGVLSTKVVSEKAKGKRKAIARERDDEDPQTSYCTQRDSFRTMPSSADHSRLPQARKSSIMNPQLRCPLSRRLGSHCPTRRRKNCRQLRKRSNRTSLFSHVCQLCDAQSFVLYQRDALSLTYRNVEVRLQDSRRELFECVSQLVWLCFPMLPLWPRYRSSVRTI